MAGRELTAEKYATTYNNYYEFSDGKDLWESAQSLKQRPWKIELGGMMKQPRTIDIDDLLKQVQLEERIYRHRCVEAWAMTVPWTGFPLSQLLKIAEPLDLAKYVVFETLQDKAMPGLRSPFYPWPYIEGLTMDEAANDLAFISTGLYAKPLPPQNGGPIRLTLPWKYGFKSAKALSKISFTDKRPVNFWQAIQPSEVRLLGQREPGRVASALEPGARAAAGQQRDGADADLQRLWRVRGWVVFRQEGGEAVHLIMPNAPSPCWPPCCWSEPSPWRCSGRPRCRLARCCSWWTTT